MDDGASSTDVACKMLSALSAQGVHTVVLTPHYYSNRESVESFVQRRENAFAALRSSYGGEMHLRLGAEVYYSDYLFNNTDLTPLCIEDTRTLLLEMPFSASFDQNMLHKIDRLIGEFNVTPVLAHIDRYPILLRSRQILHDLLGIGCAFQVNLSALTSFGKRKILTLAKDGFIGAVGTDAHNLTSRAPEYENGYRVLMKAIGIDEAEYIQDVMGHLLDVQKI